MRLNETVDDTFLTQEPARVSLFDLVTKIFPVGVDGTYCLLHEIIIAASGSGTNSVNLRPPNIFNDRFGHVKLWRFGNVLLQ